MIDLKAFRSVSYGLFLVSSRSGERVAGCVSNTFAQVTSEPLQVSISLNKENHTTQVILESGHYVAAVLSEAASMDLIGTFGFHHSDELDKFEPFATKEDQHGTPYVAEQTLSYFSVNVVESLDLGTHIMFIGTVDESAVLSSDKPMTYAYYHEIKGGRTPSRAASYIAELDAPSAPAEGYAWRCKRCGHIEHVEELPENFVCPVCGASRDKFERIELS